VWNDSTSISKLARSASLRVPSTGQVGAAAARMRRPRFGRFSTTVRAMRRWFDPTRPRRRRLEASFGRPDGGPRRRNPQCDPRGAQRVSSWGDSGDGTPWRESVAGPLLRPAGRLAHHCPRVRDRVSRPPRLAREARRVNDELVLTMGPMGLERCRQRNTFRTCAHCIGTRRPASLLQGSTP
jgi:hypothetical protein